MRVDSAALQALIADPEVWSIGEVAPVRPLLNQTIPVIDANQAWTAGFTGLGYLVAVVDTGVDGGHPFLSQKLVGEACYSTIDADPSITWTASSLCSNGTESQTGVGAAAPCSLYGCDHGTHVAGIAAGQGNAFSGVAKEARILGVQVFTRIDGTLCAPSPSPCIMSFPGDQVQALEYVLLWALGDPNGIAAANMSLGGGRFTSSCDDDPTWSLLKDRIDSLRDYRIATVIAAGNDGYSDALAAPACISTAISVGATTKSDVVPPYSNSASFLHLLAPGGAGSGGAGDVYSSVPGGGFAYSAGTSMAAPHVAGAFAVLRHQSPSATVDDIFETLKTIGVPITDSRNGIAKPRIELRDTPWTAGFAGLIPGWIGVDVSRNVYVIGSYQEYAGVLKYSGAGQLLWSAFYNESLPTGGTYPSASTVDNAGNVYVGTNLSSGTDGTALRILKYGTTGNVLWSISQVFGTDSWIRAMALDTTNNVYVASDSCFELDALGNCSSWGAVTMKLSPDGSLIWSAVDYNAVHTAIVADPTGNVVVGGGTCQVDACSPSLTKYDGNGARLWTTQFGGDGWISALFIDNANDVYAAGDSSAAFLTAKYGSAGNQLWMQNAGSGGATSIAADDQGGIYVTGGANGTWGSFRGYRTVKYDTNGNQIWYREFTSPVTASGEVWAEVIKTDSVGNVFVNGTVLESISDDPFEPVSVRARVVTLKYDTNGAELWRRDRSGAASSAAMVLDGANNLYMSLMSPPNTARSVTIKYASP